MLMHNLQYHQARLCMGCNNMEQTCAHCMAMDRKGAAVREDQKAWSNTQHRNSMSFVHHTSCIRDGHVQKGPSCFAHIRKVSGRRSSSECQGNITDRVSLADKYFCHVCITKQF